MDNLWEKAKDISIQTGQDIVGGFDVGFDHQIPGQIRDELMRFVYWVEDHYDLPVTLWVDFKYNHYLLTQDKRRVGYKFYWTQFNTWPVFDNYDDLPVIELPVRTEHRQMTDILKSFIEAISQYFMWLSRQTPTGYGANLALVEEILTTYLNHQKEI